MQRNICMGPILIISTLSREIRRSSLELPREEINFMNVTKAQIDFLYAYLWRWLFPIVSDIRAGKNSIAIVLPPILKLIALPKQCPIIVL